MSDQRGTLQQRWFPVAVISVRNVCVITILHSELGVDIMLSLKCQRRGYGHEIIKFRNSGSLKRF